MGSCTVVFISSYNNMGVAYCFRTCLIIVYILFINDSVSKFVLVNFLNEMQDVHFCQLQHTTQEKRDT